jgi:hypothetical protein
VISACFVLYMEHGTWNMGLLAEQAAVLVGPELLGQPLAQATCSPVAQATTSIRRYTS